VKSIVRHVKVNRQIWAKEVRLIDPDGKQVGVVPLAQALEAAKAYSLDLVEVAPHVKPPVCRIMDYGKYKYEQRKKLQELKRRQSGYQLKEIKIRPMTEKHDFEVKLRRIRQFLKNRDKVKVLVMFRGRELAYTERGAAVLQRVAEETSDVAVVEQESKLEGHNMVMVLAPK